MVREEPALARDAEFLCRLEALGIQKDKAFAPDRTISELLSSAASAAHEWFMAHAAAEGRRYWPDAYWRWPSSVGARTGFSFEEDGRLDVEARGITYFLGCAPPAKLGKATAYLAGWVDGSGQSLSGERTYRLRVPANVPAEHFWAATVYDAETAAFIRESPRVELNSYQRSARNADGSTDVYFGPAAPEGKEANWVRTAARRPWFTLFRLYGPGPTLFDQRWRLPDLELVD
jgi:hypothetical protein